MFSYRNFKKEETRFKEFIFKLLKNYNEIFNYIISFL